MKQLAGEQLISFYTLLIIITNGFMTAVKSRGLILTGSNFFTAEDNCTVLFIG